MTRPLEHTQQRPSTLDTCSMRGRSWPMAHSGFGCRSGIPSRPQTAARPPSPHLAESCCLRPTTGITMLGRVCAVIA